MIEFTHVLDDEQICLTPAPKSVEKLLNLNLRPAQGVSKLCDDTPGRTPLESQAKKSRLPPCWALVFGALWTESIPIEWWAVTPNQHEYDMIMLCSETWNLGIRSRSVSTVRWEQPASGWSLRSFSIYHHKTYTHIRMYNVIHQYYTSSLYPITDIHIECE